MVPLQKDSLTNKHKLTNEDQRIYKKSTMKEKEKDHDLCRLEKEINQGKLQV